MPGTRPPYPPEVRAEAVRLVRSSNKLVRETAQDLGVSEQARCGTGYARPISTTAIAAMG